MIRRFTIRQVVDKTGLEESEIRYYESVFREFLQFTEMGLGRNEFTEDHCSILLRIKELVHKRGFTVEEVRRELKTSIKFIHEKPPMPVKGAGYARVIAVTSGKGGVGKTSFTVNLAVAIAQTGRRVAVFDADLGLANVHILMGVKPRFNLAHLIQNDFSLEDIIVRGPLGIQVISGGQGVRELANLTNEQRRLVLRQIDRLERSVDILIVDTGAGISENVLRFALFADEVITVTTPNVSAAADAFSIIKILLEMDPHAKIGLLANNVRDLYEAKNVFNRLNAATQKFLQYKLGDLGHIVDDAHAQTANQRRQPLVRLFPDSDASRCFRSVVSTLLHEQVFVNHRKESSFQDLLGALKRSMAGAA